MENPQPNECQKRETPSTPFSVDLVELRDLASSVVLEAVDLIGSMRSRFERAEGLGAHSTTKSSEVDPVTEVDTASERFIVDALLRARPGDGVLGEEGASIEGSSGVTWIVDPIDGTVNFLYGLEEYAVSVGAVVDGQLAVGVVANAARATLYRAARGHGAQLIRDRHVIRELHCREEKDPALALVATGFSYSAQRRALQAQVLTRVIPQVRDIRRMGAAALDLCRVAEGTVDAYYEHGINAWDYAAGAVIAREAGAIVHEPGIATAGKEGMVTWAASGELAHNFEEILKGCGGLEPIPGS